MAWVVDTSVLLDIRLNDPAFGVSSAACLTRHAQDGLVVCPVTYIELAPTFQGDNTLQAMFLSEVGVSHREPWVWQDTVTAHQLWHEQVRKKRAGLAHKRPIADVLIEAFALRFQGVITRNPKHFASAQTVMP